MQISKQDYDRFVSTSPQGTIYSQSWWLDAVAPQAWDAVVHEKKGILQAVLPFSFSTRRGIQYLNQPPLTPLLGVLLRAPTLNYTGELSFQKDAMLDLISKLPAFDSFESHFHYTLTNWLPFYWKGFQQTTRYSYILPDISDLESIWKNIKDNIRSDVRKAEKQLKIVETISLQDFFNVYSRTFERQGRSAPLSYETLERVDRACASRNCRRILAARDPSGLIHAIAYIVWDSHSAYYLLGGANPETRGSGAQSFLVWEAIQGSSKHVSKFDFEGSMTEGIERFFRAFGATQTPAMKVFQQNSRYGWYQRASGLLSKLKGK